MGQVQIVPLGGSGEIGKNCTAVIQGDDMVLIDAGLSFPNEEMYGVDIVIPDFEFVKQHQKKLRGVFLTHAHEDHVGALPYLLREVKCPVYANELTHAMIRNKLEEKTDIKSLILKTIKMGEIIQAGSLKVEFIRVTHSIPENASIAVLTEHGHVLFTGDFKFDFSPIDGKLSDITRFAELGKEGVVCLFSDSTNSERPGWGPSESAVSDGFRNVFTHAEGRVLITTFASNIHRMQQALTVASETGRRVAVAGRRMNQTIDICGRLGYLKIPANTLISLDECGRYEPNEIVLLTTGSQGEPMSALVQMSKETYGRMRIMDGDTIIYSARPIPGNEAAIWRTVNRLFKIGATVIYDNPTPVHVSGHAYQQELKMMINLTRPFYLAPVHGEPRHQHIYKEMALTMGYPEHRIFTMADGQPLLINEESAEFGPEVAHGRVLVDNGGNTGITDDVLRDRMNLANDGTMVVTIAVDVEAGEVVGDPVVHAMGFSGDPAAIANAPKVAMEALMTLKKNDLQDHDVVRHALSDQLRRFMHRKTGLRPVIIPVVVEV